MRPVCGGRLNAVQTTATVKAKANKKVRAKQTNSRVEVGLPPPRMQTRSKVSPKMDTLDSPHKSRFPSSKVNHPSARDFGEKRADASTFILEYKTSDNTGLNYEAAGGYKLFGEFELSPSRKRKRGEESRSRSDSTISDKEPDSPESDDYKPPAKMAKKTGRASATPINDKGVKQNNRKRQISAISKAPTTPNGTGKRRQKGNKDNKSDKDLLVGNVKDYLTHLAKATDHFGALPLVVVEKIAPHVKNDVNAVHRMVQDTLHLNLKSEKDENGETIGILTVQHDQWKKDELRDLFYERVKKAVAAKEDKLKNDELVALFYEKVPRDAVKNGLLTNADLPELFPNEIAVMCYSSMPLNQYLCQLRRSVRAAIILHEVYEVDDRFKNKTFVWNKTAYQGVGNVDVNKSSKLGEALTEWGWTPKTAIPQLFPGQSKTAYDEFEMWRIEEELLKKAEAEANAKAEAEKASAKSL